MNRLLFTILTIFLFSCGQDQKGTNKSFKETERETEILDIEAELASIEDTRESFQLAIREKRYSDLGKYVTDNMKSVSPGSEQWLNYKKLREKPMGKFSYDSIVMSPQETVIVSDSVAYDFGTSKVFYTNEKGEAVELENTFLVILKKDKSEGNWKLHREVASASLE